MGPVLTDVECGACAGSIRLSSTGQFFHNAPREVATIVRGIRCAASSHRGKDCEISIESGSIRHSAEEA